MPIRRAYSLLVGVAVAMGVTAVIVSVALGEGLKDPDGSLGPSWFRLPMMVLGAFVADVVPRALWRSRRALRSFGSQALAIIREHWTRERIQLVVVGLVTFYVTYVSYRNLKNFLPRVNHSLHDPQLHAIDRALMFGHEPAVLLHQLLGETYAAHGLALVYLLFLPVSPASLIVYLVWARNISYGYWYATAQCLAWAFGTISYYILPTVGPAFWYFWLYTDLDHTSVGDMQKSLYYSRIDVLQAPFTTDSIQSVAGFASLHVGIILTLALVTQYTARHAWIRRAMWVYFGLTVVSTLYFGWHYIADDVAGAAIAILAVWLGGKATGQKFGRRGRGSHPTSSTASIPLDQRASSR
ncbi:MAG: phosphatase PAP2 family protein [Nocardioidaceae bacterium]